MIRYNDQNLIETSNDKAEAEDAKTVQSVERALSIIEILAENREPMSLGDVAVKSGLKPSTAHRLLGTLIYRGFVEQNQDGRYGLTMKLFHIGNSVASAIDLRQVARPFMRELQEKTNETVNLAVLEQGEVVYVDQLESNNIVVVRMFARAGSRGPAYCTGSGKVLLAGLDDEELDRYLKNTQFQRFTSDTITDPNMMYKELQRVRRDGYAMDLGERDEGVRCVAAPIKDHRGKVIAALSVSGPSMRMTPSYISNELCLLVKDVAARLSRQLGSRND